jgi:excisionase family DNA binding protein
MRGNPPHGRPGVASPAPTDHPRSGLLCFPTPSPESPSVRPVRVTQARFENSRSPLPILIPAPSGPSNQSDLTKQQVAECLGVSVRTLENWVRKGEFTPWRCGRVVRFDPSEVEQFRRRHRLSGPVPAAPTHRRRKSKPIALPEGFDVSGGSEDSDQQVTE